MRRELVCYLDKQTGKVISYSYKPFNIVSDASQSTPGDRRNAICSRKFDAKWWNLGIRAGSFALYNINSPTRFAFPRNK